MSKNEVEKLASALIIMGALVACGEDVQDVEYDIDDKDISIPAPSHSKREQCYGIAKAQHNDCATGNGTHCAGTATLDYQSDRWKYVKRDACKELDGTLFPKKDPRIP